MTSRPSDREIQQQLLTLLGEWPAAHILVLDPVSFEPLVEHPVGLGLEARPVLDMVVALDLIDPRDHVTLVALALRAKDLGIVRDPIRFVSGLLGEVTLFDLTEACGAFVVTLIERSAAPKSLQAERTRLAARVGHYRVNARAQVTEFDDGIVELLGWTTEWLTEIVGFELHHPDDRDAMLVTAVSVLSNPGTAERGRARMLRTDGTWMWAELTLENHLDEVDDATFHVEVLDISKEMEAQDELRARERLLHRLAEALPVGVALVDADQTIVYANQVMEALTGRSSVVSLAEQLQYVIADDMPRLTGAIDQVLRSGLDGNLEVTIDDELAGEQRVCGVTLRAIIDEDGAITGAITCVTDVTDSAAHRHELEAAATFDPLTGAYNRKSAQAALQLALERPQSSSSGCAVFFIDLNDFKQINDNFGHLAGDQLLVETADRLRAVTRTSDIVGRFGGDEFVVVCSDIRSPQVAEELGRRITERLHRPVTLAGHEVIPAASIGIASTYAAGVDADTMLERADAAMYQAKRIHSSDVHLWDDTTRAAPAGRAILSA